MENNLDYNKMPQACKDAGYCFYTACTCKVIPTPAVDELNLDERAEKMSYKVYPVNTVGSFDTNIDKRTGYKQGWKDNHASFVALVEGAIKKSDKPNSRLPDSTAGWNNALQYILNKIK